MYKDGGIEMELIAVPDDITYSEELEKGVKA